MSVWVALTYVAAVVLGSFIVYADFKVTHTITVGIGAAFIVLGLLGLFSVIFAEKCLVFRAVIFLFGLVLLIVCVAEFVVGSAALTVVGYQNCT